MFRVKVCVSVLLSEGTHASIFAREKAHRINSQKDTPLEVGADDGRDTIKLVYGWDSATGTCRYGQHKPGAVEVAAPNGGLDTEIEALIARPLVRVMDLGGKTTDLVVIAEHTCAVYKDQSGTKDIGVFQLPDQVAEQIKCAGTVQPV